MINRILIGMVLAWTMLAHTPALAVDPGEMLDDPVLEERARDISAGLRCLVCQNQSIDDSNAQLAKDLRVLVRERLVEGDSNDQVIDYVVSRYGDFVLLKPPMKASTYALWFGPVLIVVLGIFAFVTLFRRRAVTVVDGRSQSPDRLSDDEQKRIAALLNQVDNTSKSGGST
ncbi:MAG: cytochrome c-type biogenesis protein CcmH [Rhodospirillales bacterium]|nr:cytochrome c-type biogenesis protein CcmH [Rhodospirillales bacterium]